MKTLHSIFIISLFLVFGSNIGLCSRSLEKTVNNIHAQIKIDFNTTQKLGDEQGIEKVNGKYVGTWSYDFYPIIEITYKNKKFRIRECFGKDATEGTEYWGIFKNGKITADGKEEDFYKYTLPTFELLENGIMLYNCGLGPYELKKSKDKMPNVKFTSPENND